MFRYLLLAATALVAVVLLVYQFLTPSQDVTQLRLTTGGEGGVYFPFGQALAKAVHDVRPHIQVDVVTSHGSQENRQRILAGEAELGILQNDAVPDAQLTALVPLHVETFHLFVTKNSNIQNIRDLAGRRVAIGEPDSGTRQIVLQVLQHFQLTTDDFTAVSGPPQDALLQLQAGELDAMFYMASMTAENCRALLTDPSIQLVGLGADDRWDSAVPALRVQLPYLEPVTIPQGLHYDANGYPQPVEPVHTFGIRSLLVARRDVSAAVTREIVAAVFEQRSALIRKVPLAAEIDERFATSDIHLPLHEGARAHFERYQPSFLERYAESMAFVMSALFALWGMVVALRKALQRGKKDRIDVYYTALNDAIERLEQDDVTPETIDAIYHELGQLRTRAISELTRERLLADDSFQIFQALLSDCQAHIDAQRRKKGSGEC